MAFTNCINTCHQTVTKKEKKKITKSGMVAVEYRINYRPELDRRSWMKRK